MKAVRIHRFGGPKVLQLDDTAPPVADEAKLLIRVMAASVNPVDYKIRQGGYPKVTEADLPVTLGRDVSGILETAGGGFQAGAEVYAHLDWADGGYAEYVLCAPGGIAAKPKTLDMIQAAAVPLAATTAWQGLFDQGGLRAGERVLIHGASGGVGAFAVQFARIAGAEVIATASADEADRLAAYGATQVIDHKTEKFEDAVHDVDLVLDLIGKDTQDRSFQTLKRGGRLISTVQDPDPAKADAAGVIAKHFMAKLNASQLAEIAGLIDDTLVQVTWSKSSPWAKPARLTEWWRRATRMDKSCWRSSREADLPRRRLSQRYSLCETLQSRRLADQYLLCCPYELWLGAASDLAPLVCGIPEMPHL